MLAAKDRQEQQNGLTSAFKTRDHDTRQAGRPVDSLSALQHNLGNGYLQSVAEQYNAFVLDRYDLIPPGLLCDGQAFSQTDRAFWETHFNRNFSQIQVTTMHSPSGALVQRQVQSGTPSLLLEPYTISSFDLDDKPNKRPWNFHELATKIAAELARSERAYVRIITLEASDSKEDDPKALAWERAEKVIALLRQTDALKLYDESRFDWGFASGTLADPQIQISIDYRPLVVSSSTDTVSPKPFKFMQPPVLPIPPTSAPAQPGKPNLEEFTDFTFTGGPFNFAFKLPKSVEMHLPMALWDKLRIDFALKAETSGDFSFTVTLDCWREIHISLKGGISLGEDENRAGGEIVISSKRKVCRRDTADQIKTEIKAAGEKLTKAVNTLQGTERKMPPPPSPKTSIITPSAGEESEILDEKLKRWIDVAKAIGDLYEASKKFDDSCTEVPIFSVGVGVSTPLGEQKQPTPGELAKPGPFFGTYAGINLRFPF